MKKQGMLLILLFSSNCFAAQYLCSTNMQYVYTGDTQESVIAACGQPDQIINQAAQSSSVGGGNLIWFYQTTTSNQAGVSNNGFSASAGALAGAAPTLNVGPRQVSITTSRPPELNLAITFAQGYVSNIQVTTPSSTLGLAAKNAAQSVTTYACPNGPVQTGSSMNDVATACGLPVFQKNNAQTAMPSLTNANSPSASTTLLVYKPQSYLPAQTFIFQNGLLVGQK